ncbi:MAG TPA: hypothetical protein VGE02_07110 [Gemmatimonadales bacterium]
MPREPQERPPESRAADVVRVGAIDIGSNSIRQVVADVTGSGDVEVLAEERATPRLGTGLAATGALGEQPMQGAIEALERMADRARRMGCAMLVAVATSAVRDASNGAAFLQRVREATGVDVRILTGEEEALLGFRSALAHFDIASGPAVVMDIGGGSLELAFGMDGVPGRLLSLPLGAVRLSEQFPRATVGGEELRALRRHVRAMLCAAVPEGDRRTSLVIGSGGTFTNLARMHLARRGLSRERPRHATRISGVDLEAILDSLARTPLAERGEVPGLDPGRGDIIVPGLAVAAEVLAALHVDELLASRYGIREGLLLEAAGVRPSGARSADGPNEPTDQT